MLVTVWLIKNYLLFNFCCYAQKFILVFEYCKVPYLENLPRLKSIASSVTCCLSGPVCSTVAFKVCVCVCEKRAYPWKLELLNAKTNLTTLEEVIQ